MSICPLCGQSLKGHGRQATPKPTRAERTSASDGRSAAASKAVTDNRHKAPHTTKRIRERPAKQQHVDRNLPTPVRSSQSGKNPQQVAPKGSRKAARGDRQGRRPDRQKQPHEKSADPVSQLAATSAAPVTGLGEKRRAVQDRPQARCAEQAGLLPRIHPPAATELTLCDEVETTPTCASAAGDTTAVADREEMSVQLPAGLDDRVASPMRVDAGDGTTGEVQWQVDSVPTLVPEVSQAQTGVGPEEASAGLPRELEGPPVRQAEVGEGTFAAAEVQWQVERRVGPVGQTNEPAGSTPPPRKQVLVIDDDPTMRMLLKMGLRPHGYDCLTAENGRAAQEVLQNNRPDVILVDLLMPVMDGLAFIQWLRQTAHDTTPVLVFTNVDNPRVTEEAFRCGANAYACKPLHLRELLGAMNELVSA